MASGCFVKRLLPVVFPVAFLFLVVPVSAWAGFGLQSFESSAVNGDGSPDVQAGSHPYALTTSFALNESEDKGGVFVASEGLKDVQAVLPPGFIGNPNAVPKCSYQSFLELECPDDTAVGEATIGIGQSSGFKSETLHRIIDDVEYVTDPVYNVEPPGGVPAELGIMVLKAHPVLLDASVRTGGDYGITAVSSNITEAVVAVSVKATVWGVPADPSHDRLRGKCLGEGKNFKSEEQGGLPHNEEESLGACPVDIPVEPFLTNPTSCGEPREVTLSVDGWNNPGNFETGENIISRHAVLPPLEGCERLDFSPTIDVAPDGTAGSTPTGLNVDVHIPQESTANPVGLGEADMKDTTVTLPAGVQINPSAANGLQACSAAQIGFEGVNPVTGRDKFTPRLPGSVAAMEAGEPGPLRPGVNFCPEASKLASVRISTPILEHELTGAIYLAAPQSFGGPFENPFGSLIAMYLVVEEPATDVLVKAAGKVELDETTGQITTTFEDIPQAPVSNVELEFFGAARAPLATPTLCGEYTTTSSFVPWSEQESKVPSSSFQITSGPAGSSCQDPAPFKPSLTAGTTNIQAGAFSPFTMTMSHHDGDQQLQGIQLHLPPGLLGTLSSVTPCEEPEADEGTCGPGSLIGETTVSVGLGGEPFTVTGGKVYITGAYHGAPYGLSIVNPAKAGPFDLEHTNGHHPACDCLVVRARIEVDPVTSALTATANTKGEGFAIPTILEGVPLQIKHVNVTVNRPRFTFNPTSCDPLSLTGSLSSAEGATATLTVPFQVTDCAALAFKPVFRASTAAHNSRVDGASLITTVIYPGTPQGTEANIAKVKVSLPRKLSARLSTLQKACTEKTFAEDPASCPAAARVGEATTKTPVLPAPLSGPAYFVSHGAARYPELIIVLQGDNVTIDLHGETAISKQGILTSTFNTAPDAPFSTFQLTLPEGPTSALTANGANLCTTTPLTIPTVLTAQNGAVINQNTKIAVTGCPKKHTKLHRTTKKTAKKTAKKKGKTK
jgi:hypothetical protein